MPVGCSGRTTSADSVISSDDYINSVKANGTNALPYLETDIEGIFYTMSTKGEVKFYSYAENAFTPVEATGTYDVSVIMSEQKVATTVTYYEKDGVVSGYGLYIFPVKQTVLTFIPMHFSVLQTMVHHI